MGTGITSPDLSEPGSNGKGYAASSPIDAVLCDTQETFLGGRGVLHSAE